MRFATSCRFLCCTTLTLLIGSHFGHGQHVPEQSDAPQLRGSFGDRNETHEQQHLKKHLEEEINVDISKMSEHELQFHYFKMFDTDNNKKLDGLEILKAITHVHTNDAIGSEQEKLTSWTDEVLEEMIDSVFRENDLDNDGYLDFFEYIKRGEHNINTI